MPLTLLNTNNSGNFTLVNTSNSGNIVLSLSGSIPTTTTTTTTTSTTSTTTTAPTTTTTTTTTSTTTTTTTSASNLGTGSLYFSGTTTSRLRTSGSSDTTLQFGTGSFTIEWWQYLSTSASSFPRVFEQSGGPMVSIEGSSASRTFYFWGPGANSFGSITSSLNNTWNHFAVVRSGSASGNLKVYRNGVQMGSAVTNNTNFNAITAINIGNRSSGLSSEAFMGNITNFHWLKGIAKYSGSFTPTGPLLPISESTGLLILAETSASAYTDSSGYNRVMIATTASWTGSSPF